MKYFFITLSYLTFIFTTLTAQTILYSEDFSGQIGKGVVGPSPYVYDTINMAWTINVNSASLTSSTDFFKVNSSESFESVDVDGEVIWISPSIDISNDSAVNLQINISENGVIFNTEYIRVYYILDTGSEVLFETNGTKTNSFGSTTASQDSIYGDSIRILVRTRNSAGTHSHFFDDVLVSENIGNVQNLYDLTDVNSINLKWSNPVSSYDEILIVANENAPILAGKPSGNGTTYSANSVLGNGTALLGGTVIYKGTGVNAAFTGITDVNDYHIKVFTRKGATWSKGKELKVYYNPPQVGDIYITEYARHTTSAYSYLELYNKSSNDVNLSGAKIIVNNPSSVSEIIDARIEIPGSIVVPANGFLILNKNRLQGSFESEWGVNLSSMTNSVTYNRTQINNLGNQKSFQLKFGGSENTNDGTLIDETTTFPLLGERTFQLPIGYWNINSSDSATPGYIANYEDLFSIDIAFFSGAWFPNSPSSTTSSQNAAVITGNATFVDGSELNDLAIWGGAGTDIGNETVTILNDLTVKNNASVTITGNGSLNCSQITSVERAGLAVNTDYNIWGSPLDDQLDIQSTFSNSNPCDIYVFEASSQQYKYDYDTTSPITCLGNINVLTSAHVIIDLNECEADGSFDTGRGYFIPGNSDSTIVFSALATGLNNGNINVNIYGSNGTVSGSSNDWNLISNPYPSAISANNFITTNMPLITNAIYVYDQGLAANSFTTFNNTDGFNIASCQGFFVDAVSSTDGLLGTVNFTNSMRNNENANFRSNNSIQAIYLAASNSLNQKDVMRVYFDANAEDGFDQLYDANKMMGSQFNIASKADSRNLVFNGVPNLTVDTKIIPLFFNTMISTIYQFSIDSLIGDFTGKDIILEDRILRTFHDLKVHNYTFSTEANNWENRFYLHIQNAANTTSIEEASISSVLIITNESEILVIANDKNNVISSVQVIDMKGQLIQTKTGNSTSIKIPSTGMATGIYLVKYTLNNKKVGIRKVIMR